MVSISSRDNGVGSTDADARSFVAAGLVTAFSITSRCNCTGDGRSSYRGECFADNRTGFILNPPEVRVAAEALRVQLVDILRPGWTRGEPSVGGGNLEAADSWRRCQVQWSLSAVIGSPASCGRRDVGRRQAAREWPSLRGVAGASTRAYTGAPSSLREKAVQLGRVAAGAGGDLQRQQVHDDAVLVGRPHRAVAAQERGARALLAAKPERAIQSGRARTT